MKHRVLGIAIATLAFTAAHADTRVGEKQMMDACIQQYIADNLSGYQGKVTVNKLATGSQPLLLSGTRQITVSAVHRSNGDHLGTVVCNVSSDGTVSVARPDANAAAKLAKLVKTPVVARNAHE